MIALLEAYRAGLLRREHWLPNVIAGVVVGVVARPLAMAFAIASGAKPEQGLYTAIVAGLFVSACGGSRVQIAGPTGAFVVILSSITAQYGIDGLQIATLLAGVILLLLGIARLGAIIKIHPSSGDYRLYGRYRSDHLCGPMEGLRRATYCRRSALPRKALESVAGVYAAASSHHGDRGSELEHPHHRPTLAPAEASAGAPGGTHCRDSHSGNLPL